MTFAATSGNRDDGRAGVRQGPRSKASQVAVYLEQADPADQERWPQYRIGIWVVEKLGRFREVFQPIVQGMPL